ncbi:hypothetical protein FDG33_09190 [Clostridium sporogenes]|uniref:hypothetical protein n=1 Tax=Clostridium sporogenes TaxID=1509 RepID=UPI000717867E|nr:hypothetical protein [Clostridium sporogenes]KRU46316.1 hypothetical protein VT94_04900 [Clostridium sporogenes]MBY7064391.1 hypothetical protein [Clostridium sporogenes]MBY7071351.1 hypothetical protein [Clostridium sporogenes]MCW6064822.1 hypothetical protein [Clostridium sporogenes]NFF77535.1 hypothetical protein [Clostridium sporogenes]
MELQKLTKAIWDTSRRIEDGVNTLGKKAKEYAEAEKEYRLALGKEILILRDQKVQATLIPDIARGNTAELKFKRDLAEATYKTCKEMLQGLQAELSGYQSILRIQQDI